MTVAGAQLGAKATMLERQATAVSMWPAVATTTGLEIMGPGAVLKPAMGNPDYYLKDPRQTRSRRLKKPPHAGGP